MQIEGTEFDRNSKKRTHVKRKLVDFSLLKQKDTLVS